MIRLFVTVHLIIWATHAISQIYEEPPWLLPLPPPVEQYCGEFEKVSEPVFSYQISELCGLSDIKTLGEYQYGTEQVRKELMGLAEKKMVRRLVSGRFVFFNEIKIELHKASERTAELICSMDMMGEKVFDAKIVRQKIINKNRTISYDEPIIVENNRLPNLGIFTYTSEIRHLINNCPKFMR